ncbi:folate-binding protein [Alphaproteobacteria bacterium]|nr:folate-binding protein [Alphaproteobacteria bacterium]
MNNKKTNSVFAKMPDSGFIVVSGAEASDFLQSIITANVETLDVGVMRPGALLTPQGRVLTDFIIYRLGPDEFMLQCEEGRLDDLYTRLRRFRLRRPVIIEKQDDIACHIWWHLDIVPASTPTLFADPRDSALGYRYLGSDAKIFLAKYDAKPGNIDDWHAIRISKAVPQGALDLTPERALMLESGLDHFDAVDFGKGCYIGQEVTARTHYRGLVKRRLAPFTTDSIPKPLTDITLDGVVIGTCKSVAPTLDGGGITLGLIKLSDLHAIQNSNNNSSLTIDGHAAELALPDWMLPLPMPAKTDG